MKNIVIEAVYNRLLKFVRGFFQKKSIFQKKHLRCFIGKLKVWQNKDQFANEMIILYCLDKSAKKEIKLPL